MLDLRIYRALLRLFPRSFRERFGEEMAQTGGDLLRTAAARGAGSRVRVWRRLLLDFIPSLAREHRAAFSEPPAQRSTEENSMGTLWQDLRYALRALRRSPGYTAVVVLSLAIGIGANTLIYSVVDGVILRPFAYPDPDRLVTVGVTFPKVSSDQSFIEALSPVEFTDIRAGSKSLERYSVFDLGNRNISGGDRPERVFSAFLWGDPFATVGLSPALGRGFIPEETLRPGPREAVISWRIWQSRFGGDSSVVGRTIQVNGQPATVVGIMPPTLLLFGTDLWLPLGFDPAVVPRDRRQFTILARLVAGTMLAQANAELETIAARVAAEHSAEREEYQGWRLVAMPWASATLEQLRPAGFILLATVGLVLLIACANIASLMLARGAGRQREIAIRRALGAGGGRIARQLLTESLLLALFGAVLGTLLMLLLIRPVMGLFPDAIEFLALQPGLNPRVFGGTALVAILAGLLAGLAPAWQFSRGGGTWLGGESQRVTGGVATRRLRQGFTVVQIALALMLLAGAGVLLRSFQRLQQVEPGIDTRDVLTMRLSLPQEKYAFGRVAPFFEELTGRLAATPGVVSAAAATQFPPGNAFSSRLRLEGAPKVEEGSVDVSNVSERYFATLGYSLIIGRGFGVQDRDSAPRVAVLNQTAALKFFPGANPVGRRIQLGAGDQPPDWREVVGVVGDARNRGLDTPIEPEVFVPVRQQDVAANNQLFLLIRTRGAPGALLPAIRAGIAAMDPDQPVYLIHTLDEAFANSVATRRAAMVLLSAFAAIALVLAALGVYGVLSYLVSQRTHEIGIRMALGADRSEVRRLVLRQTLILLGAGTGLGLIGAIALSRVLKSLVFQVEPSDPMTLAAGAVLLASIGLIAAYGPVRRAARVSPLEALRGE